MVGGRIQSQRLQRERAAEQAHGFAPGQPAAAAQQQARRLWSSDACKHSASRVIYPAPPHQPPTATLQPTLNQPARQPTSQPASQPANQPARRPDIGQHVNPATKFPHTRSTCPRPWSSCYHLGIVGGSSRRCAQRNCRSVGAGGGRSVPSPSTACGAGGGASEGRSQLT